MLKLILVCQSTRVLLPGNECPIPASVYINRETGKIIHISQDSQPTQVLKTDNIEFDFFDVGDKIILPGLVELVINSIIITHIYRLLICQCPCTSERTRQNTLGRLLDRYTGCSIWRRHHSRRYAFEFNTTHRVPTRP